MPAVPHVMRMRHTCSGITVRGVCARAVAAAAPQCAQAQRVHKTFHRRPHLPASSIATCAGVRPAARASALILSRWSSLSSSA